MGHDAVDPVAGVDVLAEQADGHAGHGEGVGGVAAELGEGRGVGLLPGVADAELLGGDERPVGEVDGGRVGHHRQVGAVEGAALEEEDLAAATLLGRGAHDPHGEAEVVDKPGER